MKKLAKGRVSGTVLLGVLFFAAGCGSKEEDSLPNYVVNKVQTGTTAGSAQEAARLPAGEVSNVPTGGLSIIQEDITGANEKKTQDSDSATGKGNGSAQREGNAMPGQEDGIGRPKNPGESKENQENKKTDLESPDKEADSGRKPADSGNGDFGIKPWQESADENRIETDDLLDGEEGELYVTGVADSLGGEKEEPGIMQDAAVVTLADGLALLPAGTVVDLAPFTEEQVKACFTFEEITDPIFLRMQGYSYGEDATIDREELNYVRVLHYGFNGEIRIGEMVVNRTIAQEIRDIFLELFDLQYPIEKMVLVDTYGGDDEASMEDNNTSAFNFRRVEGSTSLSRHAYGLAVDINPLYNPYIPEREGVAKVLPENALPYVDRDAECDYYIKRGDPCYEAFVSRGFEWGGDWETGKDYQHFSKAPK